MLEQLESFWGNLQRGLQISLQYTTLEVGVCEIQTADEETRVLKKDS